MIELKGQVVHKRKLSKKLIFFDIEQKNEDKKCEEDRLTVVLKSWICENEIFVKATQGHSKIHVGDQVTFSGEFEANSKTFSAQNFAINEYWSDTNPGVSFQPKPPEDEQIEPKALKHKLPEASEKLCKFYLNSGKCPKKSCKYLHSDDVSKRVESVKQKLDQKILRHENSLNLEDIHSSSQRAEVFADWIIEKFGFENLKNGKILDIAGGRGDLSFELGSKRGLDCIIVDPRPGKLKRWQIKYRKKNPDVKIPKHVQAYFDAEFLKSNSIPMSSIKLVIGLHPDEATEPLIDTALDSGLDFCVIPCCVFAASFPNRRLKDGKYPTSYEDFVMYLKEKDSRILEENLPFLGKNKVLYLKQSDQN